MENRFEDQEAISCGEAKERGLRFYYTGKPCNRGHYGPRYVSSHACVSCIQVWKENNTDKIRCDQATLAKSRNRNLTRIENAMLLLNNGKTCIIPDCKYARVDHNYCSEHLAELRWTYETNAHI